MYVCDVMLDVLMETKIYCLTIIYLFYKDILILECCNNNQTAPK
jgi:hypothetical protein